MGVMALYALLLYLSPWWSSSYYLSWETGLILAALPIAYLAWQFTPDQDRVWQALRRLFLPFCWVFASWGIASVLIEGRPRALGPVTDPNVFAGLHQSALVSTAGRMLRARRRPESEGRPERMAVALEPCIAEPGVLRGQFARRDAGVAAMLLVALWSFRGYADYRRTAFAVLLVTGLSYIAVAAIFNLQIAGRMGAADQRVGQCNSIET